MKWWDRLMTWICKQALRNDRAPDTVDSSESKEAIEHAIERLKAAERQRVEIEALDRQLRMVRSDDYASLLRQAMEVRPIKPT